MFEVNGKYGTAKIFTDLVDNESISQVVNMLNQPFAEGQTIRMMPDIHAGAGCTVGTTMTVTDKICPNLIGVDIGCGMYAVRLKETEIDFGELDRTIRKYIPSGFAIHDTPVKAAKETRIGELYCKDACDLDRARRSVASAGGGNHYLECDRDSKGRLWLVIHSGSRHLGMEVATYYQKLAIKNLRETPRELIDRTIRTLKEEGRQSEIQEAISRLRPQYGNVPDALCWCDGYLLDHYLHDMKITQEFADINRRAMADIILTKMGLHAEEAFTTIHNYINTEEMILRKGAIAAHAGERVLIPMNMRDGALICIGKGNPDWNFSAPHGAGRLMSRSAAKQAISLDEFKESMQGIWTTSVDVSTIDESPMAYKPMASIIENIRDTVDIVDIIKPVYNFKAGV